MSYVLALETAGAKVIAFEQFGSYQGDWWALVEHNGVTGWINGGYGSCSGCDAFEAEFGWEEGEVGSKVWRRSGWHIQTQADVDAYQAKLAAFGADYLGDLLTQEQAIKQASENMEWDADAKEMVEWLQKNAP